MKILIRTLFLLAVPVLMITGCQKEVASNLVTENLAPPVADAGPASTIQSPVSSVTLHGSGTTTNGHIVGYLWSLVSGPNVPVIASPSSPTTAIGNLVAGNYIFQFMVVDSAGLTGVDTTSVRVLPSVQQTLTLQPSNSTTELNYAVQGSANVSAHDIDLDAGAWTSGGLPLNIRGAFKFDLSSIPAGATIISASLTLYSNLTPINGDIINANSGSNNAMYIRRITSNWTAATGTWATQPSVATSDQVLIPHTNQSFLDLVDVDVKSMVSNMLTSGNYGFMMNLQNETPYTIRQFCSSTHANAARHPKLVVVYQ